MTLRPLPSHPTPWRSHTRKRELGACTSLSVCVPPLYVARTGFRIHRSVFPLRPPPPLSLMSSPHRVADTRHACTRLSSSLLPPPLLISVVHPTEAPENTKNGFLSFSLDAVASRVCVHVCVGGCVYLGARALWALAIDLLIPKSLWSRQLVSTPRPAPLRTARLPLYNPRLAPCQSLTCLQRCSCATSPSSTGKRKMKT